MFTVFVERPFRCHMTPQQEINLHCPRKVGKRFVSMREIIISMMSIQHFRYIYVSVWYHSQAYSQKLILKFTELSFCQNFKSPKLKKRSKKFSLGISAVWQGTVGENGLNILFYMLTENAAHQTNVNKNNHCYCYYYLIVCLLQYFC